MTNDGASGATSAKQQKLKWKVDTDQSVIVQNFTRRGWARALHVTQEFGTRPGILVARAMAIESAEWRHRGGTPPGARTMRDARTSE